MHVLFPDGSHNILEATTSSVRHRRHEAQNDGKHRLGVHPSGARELLQALLFDATQYPSFDFGQ